MELYKTKQYNETQTFEFFLELQQFSKQWSHLSVSAKYKLSWTSTEP